MKHSRAGLDILGVELMQAAEMMKWWGGCVKEKGWSRSGKVVYIGYGQRLQARPKSAPMAGWKAGKSK